LSAGRRAIVRLRDVLDDRQCPLQYLHKSDGWEFGVGPSIVIVDKGVAKTLTTTTLKDDVYSFIFDQKGLMAGLGLQGSKITLLEN
jgi:lipid-binding SYLF domain-containing protein